MNSWILISCPSPPSPPPVGDLVQRSRPAVETLVCREKIRQDSSRRWYQRCLASRRRQSWRTAPATDRFELQQGQWTWVAMSFNPQANNLSFVYRFWVHIRMICYPIPLPLLLAHVLANIRSISRRMAPKSSKGWRRGACTNLEPGTQKKKMKDDLHMSPHQP